MEVPKEVHEKIRLTKSKNFNLKEFVYGAHGRYHEVCSLAMKDVSI